MSAEGLVGLRAVARAAFERQLAAIRAAGLSPNPDIRCVDIDGTFAYCDLDDGDVYLGVVDGEGATGELQALVLADLYGISDEDDLSFLVRSFLPWTTAHELGHHLRVWHNRFRHEDRWLEEQIANRMARALAGRAMDAHSRARLAVLTRRAVEHMDTEGEGWRPIIDSYDDGASASAVAKFNRTFAESESHYHRRQLGWLALALVDPRPMTLRTWSSAHLYRSNWRIEGAERGSLSVVG